MAWDIHGEPLAPGHCEVHPWVHEPYPCGICISEGQRADEARREEEEHWEREAAAHYGREEHEHLVHEDLGPCVGAAR